MPDGLNPIAAVVIAILVPIVTGVVFAIRKERRD